MNVDLTDVEIGFVVNIEILREVLRNLSVEGRCWWIASDPYDAAATGYVSIGHGDPLCVDRLNTLYFRIPVLGNETPRVGMERLVLLVDPATASPEEPGYYLENGRVLQDGAEDLNCFYEPLKHALIARLQDAG